MTSKRAEFTKLTDAGSRHGSAECICATCSKQFIRPYRMNGTRAAKPQYCSPECRATAEATKAASRLKTRFWGKVDRRGPDECWPWLGRTCKTGYGNFDYKRGETLLAHRISFMLANGYMPPEEVLICHRCDNPPCVNPKHLWPGDDKANHDDMVAKGRGFPIPVRRGEQVNTSRLSEAQAREVLASPLSNTQLARKFGVSDNAIRLIRIGKNWAHLQGAA